MMCIIYMNSLACDLYVTMWANTREVFRTVRNIYAGEFYESR